MSTLTTAQAAQQNNRTSDGKYTNKTTGEAEITLLGAAEDKPNWSFPDATQILPYNASREEWLAVRTEGIGGSDASALMFENRYKEPLDVYEDKLGISEPLESNYLMRRGLAMEDGIREEFTRVTGIATQRRGLLRNKENPRMQCSVDSMTADGGLLEIKTTNYFLRDEWDEEEGRLPQEAYWQVQHNMAVTGRTHAWVAADVGGDFLCFRVERDEDDIAALREAETEFWNDYVDAKIPPAPRSLERVQRTYSQATPGKQVTATAEAAKAVETWRALKVRESEVKDQVSEARADVERFMADAEEMVDADGKKLVTNKQNSTFSESKFRAAHPELAADYEKTVKKIDTNKLKADDPDLYTQFRSRTLR